MSSASTAHLTETAVADTGELIQPDNRLFGIIWINPKRVSGAPCFYKSRVPIKNLFDSLEAGESLDEFLDGFEGVNREQAQAVLKLAADQFIQDVRSP